MIKIYLTFILSIVATFSFSQDLLNPYLNYNGTNANFSALILKKTSWSQYNGEYEIMLDNKNPWGNEDHNPNISNYDFNNFALSYIIELVSFPFLNECSFNNNGCNQPSVRELVVPPDGYMSSSQPNSNTYWEYPNINFESQIWNITPQRLFTRDQSKHRAFSSGTGSGGSDPNTLVSFGFIKPSGISLDRIILPHSVLKHTVFLHCGANINNPIISSFSWYSDLTRGMMREYPFHYGNVGSAGIDAWDITTRPDFFCDEEYDQNDNSNCNFAIPSPGKYCNLDIDYEGFSINYTPFDPALDDICVASPNNPNNFIPSTFDANYGQPAPSTFGNSLGVYCLPLMDYTLIASAFPRNNQGITLAGYNLDASNVFHLVDPGPPIVHKYTIDKNIKLDIINQTAKTIFNPSEVYITANDLKFPTNYTFKTIRGTFPYKTQVDAGNSTENGGPYSDSRDIPVETDLFKDFHVSSQYDPNNLDHKYASIYHLESGSKLTIEPCVNIFDATFEINPGSEIVFENEVTNQINVNRYQLLYSGGIVTKRRENFLFQNRNETRRILNWEGSNYIASGANVDANATTGEYAIESNSQVTMEATNYIDLQSGFYAKGGSEFEASIKPISLAACGPLRVRNPNGSTTEQHGSNNESGYFTLSPNPTIDNSYFMFELYKKSNVKILIYDSLGKLIQQVGENSYLPEGKFTYKFQSDDLSPGIYFAKLITENSNKSLKFIKQ